MSLSKYIELLEREGELLRVPHELSTDLEIAALSDLVMKSPGGGKALLFENVKGHGMKVLVNALGSRRRMELALGRSPDAIAKLIDSLIKIAPPEGLGGLFKLLPKLKEARAALPAKIKSGRPPSRELVLTGDEVDLGKIPILRTWPLDPAPFITFPVVITRDPVTGRQNAGMYRLQVYDKRTMGMHWHIHKDAGDLHRRHKKLGKRMEIAVAVGTDPAITYAATAPLPHGIDEMMFAGLISGRRVKLAKCLTVDLWAPADAEIILEGYVDPEEERIEGPFGDHTGYYSPAEPYPVFHVTAITMRKNPVYLATVVGIPPMEDVFMGHATERIFLPLLKTQWPEVTDMSLPPEGVFHNLCIASMEKSYPRQAQRLISGFFGAGQMSFTKIAAVTGADVNVSDHRAAAREILNRLQIPEGLLFTQGVTDALDHSSPTALWGGKLGIDATLPLPGEPGHGIARETKKFHTDPVLVYSQLKGRFPSLVKIVMPFDDTRLIPALLVLDGKKPGEGKAAALAALDVEGIDLAASVEGKADEDLRKLMWRALSSVDPSRDITVRGGKLAIDATAKTPEEGHPRPWPEEVAHPPELVEKAKRTARELGVWDGN